MLRVLHLEDSELDRELIRAALNEQGMEHESHSATTKALFVAVLDESPVDVVLCDSGGPRFDGMEALALVRSRQLQAVFIFDTGHTGGSVFDGLKQSGAECGTLAADSGSERFFSGVPHAHLLGVAARIVLYALIPQVSPDSEISLR